MDIALAMSGRRSAASLPCAFLFPKRVNDKQDNRNRDTRIGDVKRRPRIGEADVQIKKEEVDHVSVKQAICQISQNAGKEKRQRYIPPQVRPPVSHQQNRHDDQCDEGNYDEESVVALERSKRCAGIRDVNQIEEITALHCELRKGLSIAVSTASSAGPKRRAEARERG